MKTSKLYEVQLTAIENEKLYPDKFGTDLATDEMTQLEICDKGPCLPLVKSPNLHKLYKNLLNIVAKFGKSDLKGE